MLFWVFFISILLSIASEFASQFIYFAVIRKTLAKSNVKMSFDWLPHKRRTLIEEYKKIVKGDKFDVMWGEIVMWLYYSGWIFLAVACLLIFFVI